MSIYLLETSNYGVYAEQIYKFYKNWNANVENLTIGTASVISHVMPGSEQFLLYLCNRPGVLLAVLSKYQVCCTNSAANEKCAAECVLLLESSKISYDVELF